MTDFLAFNTVVTFVLHSFRTVVLVPVRSLASPAFVKLADAMVLLRIFRNLVRTCLSLAHWRSPPQSGHRLHDAPQQYHLAYPFVARAHRWRCVDVYRIDTRCSRKVSHRFHMISHAAYWQRPCLVIPSCGSAPLLYAGTWFLSTLGFFICSQSSFFE